MAQVAPLILDRTNLVGAMPVALDPCSADSSALSMAPTRPSVHAASEHPKSAIDALIAARLLSEEAIARARLVQQQSGEPIETVATRLGLVSETAVADCFAAACGCARISAEALRAVDLPMAALSPACLRDLRILPIDRAEGTVRAACANPFDADAIAAMRFAMGAQITPVVATASDIEAAIDRLYGTAATTAEEDGDILFDDDLERMKDLVSDAPVIRAVNRLIADAVDARASDIHIEPTEDRLTVRFRIDGVLKERAPLPAAMRAPLVSRIKVMAGLNIAERRLPQDGRLRIAVRGHDIDLRVATSPALHGENAVLRVLDRSQVALDFATLGFDGDMRTGLLRALHRPHGIVLVTGPTGSGKTTTLYAALAELNTPDRKLLTVEDPVEHRLPGVVQVQVNPAIGLSFSSALRSFLRQDPDVMMVGEIRDGETAQIAVQAALTGHMILATLHTNSAAGAVGRLIDMGVEPFLLSSVLNAVLAQRLVRRLCAECRVAAHDDLPTLRALAADAGVVAPEQAWRATGCPACGGSGYRGRTALLELLVVDEAVARLILDRADARDIAAAASASGMRSLVASGLDKIARGETSLPEVHRVANEG